MNEIVGEKVLIAGYGVEGQSTHKYLRENFPQLKIGIADKQQVEPQLPADLGVFSGENYLDKLDGFDTIIRSPGISPSQLKNFIGQVTSATNIFFSKVLGKTIGVTGTKGKSTTATLIAQVLKKQYSDVRLVGNIGNPSLLELKNSNRETFFVIELSSQQLEDVNYSPHIAVLLAIYPEHLNAHGNFENYMAAKARLVKFQKPTDYVIFNPDNEVIKTIVQTTRSQKIEFVKDIDQEKTHLPGPGNRENLRAAITVGNLLGIQPEKTQEALAEFKGLPHRLEFVGEENGVKFYNDSLSTIPEALINAMEALGSDVETVIAGGYDRGLDFINLGEYLANKPGFKNLILFPTTGEKIWEAVKNANPQTIINKFDVESMEEAVKIAFEKTSPGKICLLSPASPSFGIFKDYADRGNQFKNLVVSNGQIVQ